MAHLYDSTYDKAHKPYVPIDTCSPAGTWIEEKRYNRSRPMQRGTGSLTSGSSVQEGSSRRNGDGVVGATSRKVLCGNWQEEAALEGDLLQMEQTTRQDRTGKATARGGAVVGAPDLGATFGASLDVIQDRGNGRYAGGFKSSPYLTADVADPTQRSLATTHRTDYNAESSNVKALYRPALGVRSQLMLQQAMAAAAEAQEQERQETAARQTRHAQEAMLLRSQKMSGTGKPSTAALMAATLADPDTVYTDSIYKATLSKLHEHESTSWDKEEIDELRQDYLADEAITLYTGNPETGKTMTVHGKTPVDPVSSSRFGKHTYFSESKYAL